MDRSIGKCNRTGSPEINSGIYNQLIFNKGVGTMVSSTNGAGITEYPNAKE